MARKYQISAEVKKGFQEWGSVILHRDSRMTERGLIKQMATVKGVFGTSTIDVQVRNFQCVRV